MAPSEDVARAGVAIEARLAYRLALFRDLASRFSPPVLEPATAASQHPAHPSDVARQVAPVERAPRGDNLSAVGNSESVPALGQLASADGVAEAEEQERAKREGEISDTQRRAGAGGGGKGGVPRQDQERISFEDGDMQWDLRFTAEFKDQLLALRSQPVLLRSMIKNLRQIAAGVQGRTLMKQLKGTPPGLQIFETPVKSWGDSGRFLWAYGVDFSPRIRSFTDTVLNPKP